MNDLKIYYVKQAEDLGYINSIYYKDKCLAHFKEDIMRIDLSVLNPFINKVADFYTIDSATESIKHKKVIITRLSQDENLGTILHMDNYKEPK